MIMYLFSDTFSNNIQMGAHNESIEADNII